jgi:nucleoporin NDC1
VRYGGFSGQYFLNERPIFFYSLFTILAVLQAAHHLAWSVNTIELPSKMTGIKPRATILSVVRSQKALQLLMPILTRIVAACVLGTIGYLWIYRSFLLSFWTVMLSPLYSFPSTRRDALAMEVIDVVIPFLIPATLLSLIWEFTNMVFSAFIAEQPLKKDRPLTDDSKDPNGSLLSGLRGKRPFSRVRRSPSRPWR